MDKEYSQELKTVAHFGSLFSARFPEKRKEGEGANEDMKDSYSIINRTASNNALKPVATIVMYDSRYIKSIMVELELDKLFHSVESEIKLNNKEYCLIAAAYRGRNMFVFVKSVFIDEIEKGDGEKNLFVTESVINFDNIFLYMIPVNDTAYQHEWEKKMEQQKQTLRKTIKLWNFYVNTKIK